MKKKFFYSVLPLSLVFALMVLSCGNEQNTDSKDIAEDVNEQRFEDTHMKDDAQFAVDVANEELGKLNVSNVALKQASSPQVKQIAQDILNRHNVILEELKSIVSGKGIALPAEPDDDNREKLNKLSSKSGMDFDKAYLDYLIDNHKDEIEAFEEQAAQGRDSSLRVWASEKLSLLREQLQLAELTRETIR